MNGLPLKPQVATLPDGRIAVFVAGALLALSRRRWIIVGVLLGMACAVKITFGIAVLAVIVVLYRVITGRRPVA